MGYQLNLGCGPAGFMQAGMNDLVYCRRCAQAWSRSCQLRDAWFVRQSGSLELLETEVMNLICHITQDLGQIGGESVEGLSL